MFQGSAEADGVLVRASASEEAEDLQNGDVNVDEAEAGDQSFEGRLVPKVTEGGVEALEIVERPGILPWENYEKQTHFESKDPKTDRQ